MSVAEGIPTEALLDGRYRLIDRVGSGGSADVHRAEDVVLGRTVAVKILRGEHDSGLGGGRVRRETALLASLNHPSIVTLYDAQLTRGRTQYLVMEYVDGRTLTQELARGPMEPARVAFLGRSLAEALSMLHARGVVHRDVKPSNVLLGAASRRGEPWTAKLADFGIAHVLDDPRMTTPGTVVGTAAYMAPEQLRDGAAVLASDVYALGLVLLEALTGQPAFPRASGAQAALARLSGPPAIPPTLGSGWSLLLTRMTRTDPSERPAASEVAAAVAQLGAGGGVGTARGPVAVAPADTSETEVLPSGDAGAHRVTGVTKVMPHGDGTAASPARTTRILVTFLVSALMLGAAVVVGAWAATSTGEAPARAISVPLTKSPPAPVISDEEESPEEQGGDDRNGSKGDDKDNPGKKDDED